MDEKRIPSRWHCLLYNREIAEEKCLDINFERFGYMDAGCLIKVTRATGRPLPEIDRTCAACPNQPLTYRHQEQAEITDPVATARYVIVREVRRVAQPAEQQAEPFGESIEPITEMDDNLWWAIHLANEYRPFDAECIADLEHLRNLTTRFLEDADESRLWDRLSWRQILEDESWNKIREEARRLLKKHGWDE